MRNLLPLPLVLLVAACSEDPGADDFVGEQQLAGDGMLSEQRFCPNALIPRKDMARYLVRMKHGATFTPPAARNMFDDVSNDSVEAAFIEQLFADGITKGVSPGKFAPNDTVPREQMAAFVVRLVHGAAFARGGPSRFTDVTNPDFVGYIEQLADDGITKGCTATEFCPHDMVPRDQMAAFLMRAKYPGSADPKGSGRFADVPSEHVLAGRMEQAVSEGIMEPCGEVIDGVPIFGVGGGYDPHPAPTIENFAGWIATTPNYGLYVHSRDKRYWAEHQREKCGGDYNATVVLDIGEVSHTGVFVKSVTFYTQGIPTVVHQSHMWLGTNGSIDKFVDTTNGLDEVGIPYIRYEVNRWFPNGQGANGDALQLQHTMIPESPWITYSTQPWGQRPPSGPGRAGVSGGLTDNPDGGFCSIILRGALPIY